jgi:hypothetical protein
MRLALLVACRVSRAHPPVQVVLHPQQRCIGQRRKQNITTATAIISLILQKLHRVETYGHRNVDG